MFQEFLTYLTLVVTTFLVVKNTINFFIDNSSPCSGCALGDHCKSAPRGKKSTFTGLKGISLSEKSEKHQDTQKT